LVPATGKLIAQLARLQGAGEGGPASLDPARYHDADAEQHK